ncbi:MAG: Smr/MutS family protein [Parvibaculaceae bacterium]
MKFRRPPDFELWDEVARTVKPLAATKRKAAAKAKPKAEPGRPASSMPVPVPRSKIFRQAPPPLTGLDRKSERQMTRGKVEIESRIDLHGTGVERARERLHSFIVSQRSNGQRMVLVITGKGESPFARHTLHGSGHYHAPERQGVLRRKVPEWLHEAEFRAHVAGFQPAHPRHGGGGAYYVKLRRKERGGL